MSPYLKVRDHKHLVRDPNSKAILANDVGLLNKYKEERENKIKLDRAIKEHDVMKKDIEEIKDMLKSLLGKVS